MAHAPLNHRFGNVVGWLLEQPLLAIQKHVCNIDPNESGDCKAFTGDQSSDDVFIFKFIISCCGFVVKTNIVGL